MATTDPLTGATIQDQSDAAIGGTQIGNVVKGLRSFTVPRFTTTGVRDTAYAAYVTAGGTMADGMRCSVNGVPYRRIAGVWRIDRHRKMSRSLTLGGGAGISIVTSGSAESGVTSGVAALSSITLYEAGVLTISAAFRAGGTGAAQCTVKVNGSAIGSPSISRTDVHVPVVGMVALAAGTHSIAARVDAASGSVTWVNFYAVFSEGIAE